jgi:hypothetical protein
MKFNEICASAMKWEKWLTSAPAVLLSITLGIGEIHEWYWIVQCPLELQTAPRQQRMFLTFLLILK